MDSLPTGMKPSSKQNSFIYFNTGYSFGSNAITNGLISTYLSNGFISDDIKDKVSSNLKNMNRLGGDFNASLGCKIHCDTLLGIKNVYYSIELKDANHIDAGFSKDLFEVYFRGNANYGGRTADFSNFNYNLLQYRELKLGLSKDYKRDSSATTVSVGISLVNGQNFQRIKAGNATLYTDPNGEFIDAAFNMQFNQSDSLKKNLFASNGYGLATDLSYTYRNEKKKYFISFSVEDLGFIEWNNHSSQITADSSYHFEGIVSNDLFNFQDTIKGKSPNLDSVYVQPFLNHHVFKTYTTLLPAIFTLSAGKELKTSIPGTNTISLNVNYRINANYIPMTWIELSHESAKRTIIKIDFAYGGYSTFFINAGFEKKFENGWHLSLGVSHIYEMIDYMNGRGQGAFVSLSKNI